MTDARSAGAPGSEELLRSIFDSAMDYAIFSLDPSGLVTSWNSGAQRLMGWPAAEIVGQTADVIFTPEDRADGVPQEERAAARTVGRAQDERWQQRRDGSRFWASGLMMRQADPSMGYIKILRDYTQHHLADEHLRQSEERFRLLATSIPQLVFRGRSNGYRTWPSPQWIDFTGVGHDDSLGLGWLDAVHPDDRASTLAAWKAAEHSGEHYSEQRVRRKHDAQWRWHQTRARPARTETGVPDEWVGTMTDVHDLRSLQERQKVLMAELQHRTRNVLAVAHAIAIQTLRSSDSLDAFRREFEKRLQALSRVQGVIASLDYGNVDLHDLLAAELQAYEGWNAVTNRVTVEGPAVALPPPAAQALGLAVHELVTNAAKYGALSDEAGRLAVTWRLRRNEAGRLQAELDWKESGVKIAAEGDRRRGYGRELIERALPYQLGAETKLTFEPDGVHCTTVIEIEEEESEEAKGG